jgi:outer membrane protein assembly factor BamB/tetratricopeptide (TPR) repeat protein
MRLFNHLFPKGMLPRKLAPAVVPSVVVIPANRPQGHTSSQHLAVGGGQAGSGFVRTTLCLVAVASLVAASPLHAEEKKPPKEAAPQAEKARAVQVQVKQIQQKARAVLQQRIQLGGVAGRVTGSNTEEEVDGALFVEDRATLQTLNTARELLEKERYSEAVRFLNAILERPQDFWFQPDKEKPVYRSMKSEAQRLVGLLPLKARQSYELQFGAQARRLLDTAVESADLVRVAEVSRRYFHTEAGYEATYLLGMQHFDQDEMLAAALCFQRLRVTPRAAGLFEPILSLRLATCWARAGADEQATSVLSELKARFPEASFRLAGEEVSLFKDDSQALTWLNETIGPMLRRDTLVTTDQWVMFRGNSTRTATSKGTSPLLEPRWRARMSSDPELEKMIHQLAGTYVDREMIAMPSSHPLVVSGTVLLRSPSNLVAVDFETGKRIWEIPIGHEVQQVLNPDGESKSSQNVGLLLASLDKRLWDDATYGTMSSDGEQVFCVEDLDLATGNVTRNRPRMIVNVRGIREVQSTGPQPHNRLAAYELSTQGKLKWEIGGPRGEFALEAAGTFFLGPPLPLMGRLYVLGEVNGEIRLLELERSTGEVLWSQQLAVVERDILTDPVRRLAGVSPSYSNGVLVCPTSAGAVVGVDLTTRSLLWGYRYKTMYGRSTHRFVPPRFNVMNSSQRSNSRWVDASATIDEGSVLVTPVESNELHCLNLIDGSLEWVRPREEGLYLAGIHDSKAIVVGRTRIYAYNREDGEPLWQCELPEGAVPSGRGFMNRQRYYIPLTTAEVATADLDEGKIVARSTSRNEVIPGNLVSYRGSVISQGVSYVEKFDQLAALDERVQLALKDNPRDPRALADRGEIRLHRDNLEEAIADLRASFESAARPRTQELLLEALLRQLEGDFASHRENQNEIERLIMDQPQRSRYLRVVAKGEESIGDPLAAFQTYLQMASHDDQTELQRIEPRFRVRADRWVRTQLTDLYSAADGPLRQSMEETIATRMQHVTESKDTDALRRFLAHFGGHPAADPAREALLKQLQDRTDALERERLLIGLTQDGDAMHQRSGVTRLARLMSDNQRDADAAHFYRRLSNEWADEICLDGKTGRELVEGLKEDDPVRQELKPPKPWPTGRVEKVRDRNLRPVFRYYPVELEGDPGPFFRDLQVEFEQGRQEFIAHDRTGRLRWNVSLMEEGKRAAFGVNVYVLRAVAHGHLLIVSLGDRLAAIDTLGGPDSTTARVLWIKALTESIPGLPFNRGFSMSHTNTAWGGQKTLIRDSTGVQAVALGPISDESFVYAYDRVLTAVDPLTGDTLWKRYDVGEDLELFGDAQQLYVASRNQTEAEVLRMLDGKLLAKREIPPYAERMHIDGHRILRWNIEQGKTASIQMFDAWEQKTLWKREIAVNSRGCLVGQDSVGVLEENNHLLVLNLADGAVRVDAKLYEEEKIKQLIVVPSRDQLIVIVNREFASSKDGISIFPVPSNNPNDPTNPLVDGWVYAFDRKTGEQQWATEVDKQGISLSQPTELPMLTFVTRIYEQKIQNRQGREKTRHFWTVQCLDKRTGKMIHNEQMTQHISYFDVAALPEENQIEVRLQRDTLKLTFTDKPRSEEGEAQDEAKDSEEADTDKKPSGKDASEKADDADPFSEESAKVKPAEKKDPPPAEQAPTPAKPPADEKPAEAKPFSGPQAPAEAPANEKPAEPPMRAVPRPAPDQGNPDDQAMAPQDRGNHVAAEIGWVSAFRAQSARTTTGRVSA